MAAAALTSAPQILSLLPPLVTLTAAVALKNVVLAMLLGIASGAILMHNGNPILAVLATFDHYLLNGFVNVEHAGVIIFTCLLGGTIGLVQKSGGAQGLAALVKKFFTTRRKGLVSTAALGSLIFFDDYSSILIVGNALRPLIRAVRISAAKFAFVTHSIGVCLASLSPISSWVGLQIGYIAAAYSQLGPTWASADPFVGFIQTLRFRFFPLSMLSLVGAVCALDRDFGPMAESEGKEEDSGEGNVATLGAGGSQPEATTVTSLAAAGPLDPKPETPRRAVNALVPFGIVVASSFAGMIVQGRCAINALPAATRPSLTLMNTLRFSDSITALVWGSVFGWLSSLGLVLSQRLVSLSEAMEAWTEGIKDVLEPTIVLLLAWGLGSVISDVGTAQFLARTLQVGLPAWCLPALISILGYAISFACGSSFGTMGILFPLVGPLALVIGKGSADYIFHCFGATLGGAIFGNVCSPLSDTSILTTLASRCSLTEHVRTTLPYAALAALVALAADIAVGAGVLGAVPALGACITSTLSALYFLSGRKKSK